MTLTPHVNVDTVSIRSDFNTSNAARISIHIFPTTNQLTINFRIRRSLHYNGPSTLRFAEPDNQGIAVNAEFDPGFLIEIATVIVARIDKFSVAIVCQP